MAVFTFIWDAGSSPFRCRVKSPLLLGHTERVEVERFISHRMVSLWEIMRYQGFGIANALQSLRDLEEWAKERAKSGAINVPITKQELDTFIVGRMNECKRECEVLQLTDAWERLDNQTRVKLRDGLTYGELQTEATVLRDSITNTLWKRRFAYIPVAKADFQDKITNNWEAIWKVFPKAEQDIREAVECYCLERNTAAVFHFMRVAEHGMRAAARKAGVKLPNNRKIEFADWQEIIRELNNKANAIANKPRGAARDRALGFYRSLIADLQAFKDEYRNHVMHTRTSYDDLQSARVMRIVRDFMERISQGVK